MDPYLTCGASLRPVRSHWGGSTCTLRGHPLVLPLSWTPLLACPPPTSAWCGSQAAVPQSVLPCHHHSPVCDAGDTASPLCSLRRPTVLRSFVVPSQAVMNAPTTQQQQQQQRHANLLGRVKYDPQRLSRRGDACLSADMQCGQPRGHGGVTAQHSAAPTGCNHVVPPTEAVRQAPGR